MPQLFSRIAWGARPARSGPGALTVSRVKGIAVHWPGMRSRVRGSESVFHLLRNIQREHMDGRGYSDIAYQVAVDQDGNRYELRGLRTQSAANGDTVPNEEYGAVLLVLAIGEAMSDAMVTEVRNVVRDFRAIFPNGTAIKGHGQVRPEPTACPGPAAQAAINAGEFEPVKPEPAQPKPLVQKNRTRVAAVNMHAPGADDDLRMERAIDRFSHLDVTVVALSEFNLPMARKLREHPKWGLHRATPNSGTSGNAVAFWKPVWRRVEVVDVPVQVAGRVLTMAGLVLEHRKTGYTLPVLAVHNPPRHGGAAMAQADRQKCLWAEEAWSERMTTKYGRALVLGDFNEPDALIPQLDRGAGRHVDEIYGRGVTFSSPDVHEGFLEDGITDHVAVSALIRVNV